MIEKTCPLKLFGDFAININVRVFYETKKSTKMNQTEFKTPQDYAAQVEKKKKEARKMILKEFKAKGIDNLFSLREDFMSELRDIFENYPVCRSLLTRITSEISPRVMFERGLEEKIRLIGALPLRAQQMPELIFDFQKSIEGHLQIFIRDVVRSIWIFGFVVTTYDVLTDDSDKDCHDGKFCFPRVVDDNNYLVFRDNTGTLYARGLSGEDYEIYFMDKPDVNGFVLSAMAHLYSYARYIDILRLCHVISARNAVPSVLVTSKRPDPEEEERKMRSDFEKRENKVTGYAVDALLRSKPFSSASSNDAKERDKLKTSIPKLDLDFEREFVDASNNNERLTKELYRVRREAAELRWLQQCNLLRNLKEEFGKLSSQSSSVLDDFVREQLVYKIDEGAESYSLEGHRLDVKPLDIDSAVEEFNHHVKNVLLGTTSFSERGRESHSGSKYRKGSTGTQDSLQRVVDACVYYWQQFLVNNVLKKWMEITSIPLKPGLQKKKDDVQDLMPLLRFVTAERQAKIFSEVLEVPEADIFIHPDAWTTYVRN